MIRDPHYDFSFAGLKTAVRYFVQKEKDKLSDEKFVNDVSASVEQAFVDVLVAKTARAAKETGVKTVRLAGGVAANRKLRQSRAPALAVQAPGVRFFEPPLTYCTDNAAMIAMAGHFRLAAQKRDDWRKMEADPHWELGRT